MTGLVILHAPGDGVAADRLAEAVAVLGPAVHSIDEASAKPDEKTPLILYWSFRAQSAGWTDAFEDAAELHEGPVFVCLGYGEDLPAALTGHRLIAPDISLADFNAALRAQQIFARERREREALQAELEKRRARARSGKAFAGGAMMGFATSVALVGALGAGAISAAGQLAGKAAFDADPDQLRLPPGVPMIQPLPHDVDALEWSQAQLEVPSYAAQVALVEAELARAEDRMNEAPLPRVHVETRFASASEDAWRQAPTAPAPIETVTPIQVAALEAKIDADQLLEIPDLAPDFWRLVAAPEGMELAKAPEPQLITDFGDFGSDDGLWRPS